MQETEKLYKRIADWAISNVFAAASQGMVNKVFPIHVPQTSPYAHSPPLPQLVDMYLFPPGRVEIDMRKRFYCPQTPLPHPSALSLTQMYRIPPSAIDVLNSELPPCKAH